mmetsp:Transcript_63637/g.166660  ORF Transcript_63637/g.166660 Transcript_63637/m.166660 type:complete len:266 (-) Transcript_63637:608-1405(-)
MGVGTVRVEEEHAGDVDEDDQLLPELVLDGVVLGAGDPARSGREHLIVLVDEDPFHAVLDDQQHHGEHEAPARGRVPERGGQRGPEVVDGHLHRLPRRVGQTRRGLVQVAEHVPVEQVADEADQAAELRGGGRLLRGSQQARLRARHEEPQRKSLLDEAPYVLRDLLQGRLHRLQNAAAKLLRHLKGRDAGRELPNGPLCRRGVFAGAFGVGQVRASEGQDVLLLKLGQLLSVDLLRELVGDRAHGPPPSRLPVHLLELLREVHL